MRYKPIFSFYTEGNLYRKSVARQDIHIHFFRQFSETRCQFFGAGCRPFSFLLLLYRNTINQLVMFDQKDDSGKAMIIFRKTSKKY